jgi:hypothetical protein
MAVKKTRFISEKILGLKTPFESGETIPSGSDLNNYKTPGVYTIISTAIAQTISNTPVNSGMSVWVVLIGETTEWEYQIAFSTNGNIYVRELAGTSGFNTWKKIDLVSI